jgi:type III secretion protein U
MAGWFYDRLGAFIIETFELIPTPDLYKYLGALYGEAMIVIFIVSMPVLVLVCIIGVLINFLAIGPTFSTEVFKPDIKKFNPITNLKQKFKLKTLVELLKSLLKVGIAAYLIYLVMYKSLPVLTNAVHLPLTSTLLLFKTFLMEVVIKVGLFFIVIAIFDFVYQRRTFAKEMMMEKFEIKQEYKNTEGDPHIKGHRRQLAQEIAYQDGPAAGVKQAKAVVTNPTHLAIAIGYKQGLDPAPYVTAMGKDLNAERIIKLAQEYGIPVVRNIPLAHKLWENGDVWDFVPEDTYKPLAEILRWIATLNTDQEYELELSDE